MDHMIEFHGLTDDEFKTWLLENGEKGFRASQIFNWIYQRGISDWDSMTNLNKELRLKLSLDFCLSTLKLKRVQKSTDNETIKFLWQLADEKLVESVLIISGERRTVCVSSQVGCPARCAFCASGRQGLVRNLTPAEIVEQVYQIDQWLKEKGERVSHVVYMGMGEPFENYEAVVRSIRFLIDPNRFNLSQRRLTVSTVGNCRGS